MSSTRTKIVVAGGVAALTLGGAVPAVAHDSPGSGGPGHHQPAPVTLAQAQTSATAVLDHETTWLTAVKSQIAANTFLSTAEKAAWTAKIDAALAAVATAKTAVADATTVTQVRAALKSSWPRLTIPRPSAPTLADMKERATSRLTALATKLTSLKAKVAADDHLTDAQRAAFTAKIDQRLAAIATAEQAVTAATTRAAAAAALAAAHLSPLGYPGHHRGHTPAKGQGKSRTKNLGTKARRSTTHGPTLVSTPSRSVTVSRGDSKAGDSRGDRQGQARGDRHHAGERQGRSQGAARQSAGRHGGGHSGSHHGGGFQGLAGV